ncbi:MAG: PorT family protein [Bacteroidaceae bacterium]|jgi:hypothetical protein|nr:PorT family protein [Bacteroidaceae bacterium]
MKKIFGLFAAICLFTAMPATAQFNFGIKAGVNLSEKPSLNINELKNSLQGNTGWFVGPTAKFIFPVVGLGIEANVLYSQANIEVNGQNLLNQSIDIPLYLRYEITLPVVNKFLEPFVAVGPQFGWNIGNKNVSIDNVIENVTENIKFKESNISLNLGLGVILFDHLQVHANYNLALGKTADVTATYKDSSLIDISKNIAEMKSNIWQISLAYIF